MTPRQIMAYMIVAGRRIRIEKAQDLNLDAIAARGEIKYVEETTAKLMRR